MDFDTAFDLLIGHEGGYSFNAADPGGETNWGITARVARANGYGGSMRFMPRDTAKVIAKQAYWDAVQADKIPDALRFDVFDGAYNSGTAQSIKWMQRAVGAVDDGVFGPATLKALQSADPILTAKRYNGNRLQFMTNLATWGVFGKGWARRIAENLLK